MNAARLRLLYDNQSPAGVWTASSEIATLPVANLATTIRTEPWRTTAAAAQWAKGYFAGGITIGGFALVSGNLTPAAVVHLEGNATDAWGAPAFTHALTPWTARLTQVLPAFFAAAQTYAWWRLTVDDPTNPDGYLQLGALVLSPAVAFTRGPNGLRYRRVDLSATKYAGGQPYTTERPSYTALEVAQPTVDDTLLFGDLVTAVDLGRKRDVVLAVIGDDPSGAASTMAPALNLYGRLDADADFQWIGPAGRFRGSLTFRETPP